jgi:hypothetical protein
LCNGWDNYGDSTTSNIRVSIGSLVNSPLYPNGVRHDPTNFPAGTDYLTAPMFLSTTSGYPNPATGAQLPRALPPLVATEDFFKWGVNIGVWKHAYNGVMVSTDTPMLFPASREPAWGTVAIASARVGLPNGDGSYIWQFLDKADRSNWCQSSLQNLYYGDVQAQIFPSKHQVIDGTNWGTDSDLDDEILQGTPVTAIDQSGLSYLWGAILMPNNYIFGNQWTGVFNGQPDPRVGNALSNMQNRQGASFDYGSAQMNQVVEH